MTWLNEAMRCGKRIVFAILAAAALTAPATAQENASEAMMDAVMQCWTVDVGAASARVSVTVRFEVGTGGLVTNDVRLVGAFTPMGLTEDGAIASWVMIAYQSGRRAVLRCEQSDQFQAASRQHGPGAVFMTFDPRSMRVR